jgi:hypothetical protein
MAGRVARPFFIKQLPFSPNGFARRLFVNIYANLYSSDQMHGP